MIRISGPLAQTALGALAGATPAPRRAALRTIIDPVTGHPLDIGLVIWFPGPNTATGENLAEIHAHGGRATVRAIERALAGLDGLRPAEPGEFTRRALTNGRMDLTEVEGLADLLAAETEAQRRQALAVAGGALSRRMEGWQAALLTVSARVEALLDFSDEDDVAADAAALVLIHNDVATLAVEISAMLDQAPVERLRDGIVVVIAGPPNAGKSTLINALVQRDAAIVSPVAGTTRDIIDVPVAIDGIAFRLIDTAGLRDGADDSVEAIGIVRARSHIAIADIVLWLGAPDDAPAHPMLCRIAAQADRYSDSNRVNADDWADRTAYSDIILSAITGDGMSALTQWLVAHAGQLLPREGDVALNDRHRRALSEALQALTAIVQVQDPLILAEYLRHARHTIDTVTGRAGVEDMLDALFGRFCIGK